MSDDPDLDIDPAILDRSFTARNGEIGLLQQDVPAVIAAFTRAGIAVLGWEAWLTDHRLGPDGAPVPSPGDWTGIIPAGNPPRPSVLGASTGAEATIAAIASLDLPALFGPGLAGHIRFNITLDD